jgi:hypothetical protein
MPLLIGYDIHIGKEVPGGRYDFSLCFISTDNRIALSFARRIMDFSKSLLFTGSGSI